ncbi:MAG: sensor domain-containing protein [Thermoplasmatota archaeon]
MVEYTKIKDYTKDLRRELEGVDEAIVSDAMDDAEEHLSLMADEIMASDVKLKREEAITRAVKDYGTPKEVASAYIDLGDEVKEKEEKIKKKRENRSLLCDIFCVYGDGRTYLSLLYLFLMFPLGLIYFTYLVTMLSLSLSLAIFIFGILVLVLFLMSNYGLAYLHSRLTELMLGVRMPKKPRKLRVKGNFWQKLKAMFNDPRMYSSVAYMFLMFPLGIIYFTVFITLIFTAIALMLSPFTALMSDMWGAPIGIPMPTPARFVIMPLSVIIGFILLTWTLHLSNITAYYHGKLTKALLLRR